MAVSGMGSNPYLRSQQQIINNPYNRYPVDKHGSDLLANPGLQYPREDVVDVITDKVEEASNVKRDTFNPDKDKIRSYITGAVAVAAVGLAIFAFLALSSGLGWGLLSMGLILLGVAATMAKDGQAKEANIETVNSVYKDANRQRIGKTIDYYQKAAEAEAVVEVDEPRRSQRKRGGEQFMDVQSARKHRHTDESIIPEPRQRQDASSFIVL